MSHAFPTQTVRFVLSLIATLFVTGRVAFAQTRPTPVDADYHPLAGTLDFKIVDEIWHDAARDRDVPVRIFEPVETTGKLPVIIFSHGLGGSCLGYGYLGKSWASHGYVSVHLTHHGSDTEALDLNDLSHLKQQELAIATTPINAVNRCRDASFAIDQLKLINADEKSPLYNKLDLERIGMAGHSFGAGTTMLIAGQATHTGKTALADPRIKCAIALCPPVSLSPAQYEKGYSTVKVPLFVMTGTLDDSPVGETTAAQRRVPFDHVKDIPAFLITFDGADHMVFSGRPRANHPTDNQFHKLILQGSLAFWDGYLRGDDSSKAWLKNDFAQRVGAAGVFEKK